MIDALEELELARRCLRGDQDAQRRVFRLLRVSIHRTLFRIMGSNSHVRDLAQDTFLQVFRSMRSFRGEARLATWADVIATRVAFRHLSRRPVVATHLSLVPELVGETPSPEGRADAREAVRRLYAILDRLEPKYRVTYALHVIDGRSLHDVAKTTGTTRAAAKNRMWRARKMVNERARRDPLLRSFLECGGESP